jgi:hypothetical protein
MNTDMKRYAWIALGLVASLIWAWTAVARLPSNQINSRGIYIQFDNIFNNIDAAHGFPVVGGHQRWQWKNLEPSYDNDYRFDEIRSFVSQQDSVGKKAALGIETFVGRINQSPPYGSLGVPQWLWQTYPNVALWNPRGNPPYWYTLNYLDANYKAKYQEFVYAFADWLAANPDVTAHVGWIEMGVGMYSETQPSDQWVTQNWPDYAFYADDPPAGLGWSGADWEGYVNWCTDTYYHAFRVRNPSLSFIPLFLNCAPDFKGVRDDFSNYAAQKGIGLKNNGLQVDRHPYYLYGPLETWGAVTAPGVAPIAWETYEQWLTNETELYWGLLCALDKHPDVLEPDRWLMVDHSYNKRANYVAIWNWIAPYLGVTPDTTPGIWCALRETEFPSNGEPGNFDFWLFQRTNLTGGASVTAWNVTGYKEGRYTRRTDQSSGNPYMHFQVLNPSTFYNGPGQVTVHVTYLDQGSDSWRLTYDSTTGEKTAGTVTKTNTNTWKKQSFVLSDARFRNGYGPGGVGEAPDLKIDCMNNGDEYIHLIEVVKSGGGPTPTPTQTTTPCSIQGSVSLQGRPAPPHTRWSVPLTVNVCGTPHSVTTDQMGNFTVSGLTPGTCDIQVKNGHTLSNKRTGYTLVNGVNPMNMGELKEGDANNDNTVNSSDFLLLRGSYFKSEGQPGFVDGADFNEDGTVNSSDFLLLRSNYFLSGPIEVGGGGGQGGAQSLALTATALDTASIAIDPALTTVQEGDVFELDIRIDAGEVGVAVTDVYVDLQADNLQPIEIVGGGSLEIIATRIDDSGGTVDIAAGTFGTPVTGSFVLATVRFRAKANTQGATTPVTFSLTPPRETVVKDDQDHNLLQTATSGAVRIDEPESYSLYLPAVLH